MFRLFHGSGTGVAARMLALYALLGFAAAGERLFLPINNLPGQQSPSQTGEVVYVPVDQAWAAQPQLLPAGAVPQGYYVGAIPQQEDRSVSMSWAFTGALLLGMGMYYTSHVATLGAGGHAGHDHDHDHDHGHSHGHDHDHAEVTIMIYPI